MGKKGFRIVSVYLFSFSFVLLCGASTLTSYARENLPIGQMISKGDVRVEVGETWKPVESSDVPLVVPSKVKTADGVAALCLRSNVQIEVAERTTFSFPEKEVMALLQGVIRFRIPEASRMTFHAGDVFIEKSKPGEFVIGSISLDANGLVSVESLEGGLTVYNRQRMVLASLSSNEVVTISSSVAKGAPRSVTVARASRDDATSDRREGFQAAPMGLTITTQPSSEGEGRISRSGESTGFFPQIREVVRKRICP